MRVIKTFFDIYCAELVFGLSLYQGLERCTLPEDKGSFSPVIVIISVDIRLNTSLPVMWAKHFHDSDAFPV